MQKALHLDFEIQYEFSTMKKLSKRLLRVKLSRYLNIDLLCNFMKFGNSSIFDKSVTTCAR